MTSVIELIDPRRDSTAYAAELELRFRVLREPLGLPRADVTQPGELDWVHVIARVGDRVVGCVLLAIGDPAARLRQMAVAPELHGRGVGRALVSALEREAIARGVRVIAMHARTPAVGFYERLGYAAVGELFTEVGIPHRAMERALR